MATLAQLPVIPPQPAPADRELLSFGNAMREAGILIGEQRAYERLGIPWSPPSSLLASHTDSACATILSLARQ